MHWQHIERALVVVDICVSIHATLRAPKLLAVMATISLCHTVTGVGHACTLLR